MSTVLAFNPITDLAAAQSGVNDVRLTWSAVTPILTFVNGDAELGNVGGANNVGPPIGWTASIGNMRAYHNATRTHVNVLNGGTSALSKSSQRFCPLAEGLTIDEIDTGSLDITVDWQGGAFIQSPIDQPQLHIKFLSAALAVLSTHSSGYKSPSTAAGDGEMNFNAYQEVATIPVGTRFIDIELDAKRNNGTNNDASFDGISYTLESAQSLPFVPGYAIYQDGVLVALASPNSTEALIEAVSFGDHNFQVVACDSPDYLYTDASINLLSATSNTASITLELPGASESRAIFGFDDEQFFTGYLGGRLRGTTIACPGENANKVKSCC